MLRRSFLKTLAAIAVAPFIPFVKPAKKIIAPITKRLGFAQHAFSIKGQACGDIIAGQFVAVETVENGVSRFRAAKEWHEIVGVASHTVPDGGKITVVVRGTGELIETIDQTVEYLV
jgi:hypothetical protein